MLALNNRKRTVLQMPAADNVIPSAGLLLDLHAA